MRKRDRNSSITSGLILIALGIIFFAQQMGADWRWGLHNNWPVILLVIGAAQLFVQRGDSIRGGLWLLFLGTLFMLHTWHVVPLHQSWPLFIVAGGISILLPKGVGKSAITPTLHLPLPARRARSTDVIETRTPAPQWTPQIVLGLIIIAVGLVFLAGNFDLLNAEQVLSYWPVPILVLGAVTMINADSNARRVFGAFILFIGVWGLGHQFWGIRIRIWNLWPAVMIAAGVLLILRSRAEHDEGHERPSDGASGAGQTLREFAFWSGKERRVSSSFKRGDLTAVMGGIELDLRSASMTSGQAVVEVFAFWGGIEIRVPPDWIVENQVTAILGGTEDKSGGSPDARNRLILRGVVVMGGLEVMT